jgi:hypothetical protein
MISAIVAFSVATFVFLVFRRFAADVRQEKTFQVQLRGATPAAENPPLETDSDLDIRHNTGHLESEIVRSSLATALQRV